MLYLIAWLTDFAAIMFIFVSTRALAEEKASIFALGLLGACYALASGLANTVSGRLADRVGRRPVALVGTAIFFLGIYFYEEFFPPTPTEVAGHHFNLFKLYFRFIRTRLIEPILFFKYIFICELV